MNNNSKDEKDGKTPESQNSLGDANLLKRLRLYIKGLRPMLLSHHPNCKDFERHTIKIGKYRFCIGCYVGYPTAIVGAILIYILNFTINFSSQFLFVVGAILMSSFLLSPLKLTKKKIVKVLQKATFNLGGAFLFIYIWSLPNPFIVNFFYLGV